MGECNKGGGNRSRPVECCRQERGKRLWSVVDCEVEERNWRGRTSREKWGDSFHGREARNEKRISKKGKRKGKAKE